VDYTINTAQSGGADMTLDLLEAIKATLSSNRIAHWPLTDGSVVAIKDEVQPGYPAQQDNDNDNTSTNSSNTGTGSVIVSTNTYYYSTLVGLPYGYTT
jgi:hypothetical protein